MIQALKTASEAATSHKVAMRRPLMGSAPHLFRTRGNGSLFFARDKLLQRVLVAPRPTPFHASQLPSRHTQILRSQSKDGRSPETLDFRQFQ
jgi:hypothetical protein